VSPPVFPSLRTLEICGVNLFGISPQYRSSKVLYSESPPFRRFLNDNHMRMCNTSPSLLASFLDPVKDKSGGRRTPSVDYACDHNGSRLNDEHLISVNNLTFATKMLSVCNSLNDDGDKTL
jgi:hypothetical protein